MKSKKDKIKEIKEQLIPNLEVQADELRMQEVQQINHREDLLCKQKNLKIQIEKCHSEMKKCQTNIEYLENRRHKTQVCILLNIYLNCMLKIFLYFF